MAPFGRKFLKTRLKNRSEGKDAELGKEIQVWVRQEEKTVCGLTKHTRCADVVQALLEDQGASGEVEVTAPSEYYLLERWKGFERALPPLTRILRLWMEWGDEQPFVQFVLVRSHDYRPRIGRPLREQQPGSEVVDQAPAQYVRTLPVDRQKRMVRKAFRKLQKIREKERAPPGDGERVSSLVQLIISQDRAIREQAKRMQDLDLEIERAEWRLGPAFEDVPPSLTNGADWQQPEGGLQHLERQLERHRDLIERLSYDIDSEMRSACSPGGGDELELRTPASQGPELGVPPDAAAAEELERVKRGLEHSMYRGLDLHSQLADLERELELNQAVLGSKSEEFERLAEQLSALCVPDYAGLLDSVGLASWTEQSSSNCTETELQKVLSQGDGTDTDSDTGISSTHSQDSLSPCGDVRPPLETQV